MKIWRTVPTISSLETVFPVIKVSANRRRRGELHFPVRISGIITADSVRETLQGITWKFVKKVGVLWARFLSIQPISGALDFGLMRHSSSLAMRLPYLLLLQHPHYRTRSIPAFRGDLLDWRDRFLYKQMIISAVRFLRNLSNTRYLANV